jgi:hypothetical protein
MARWEPNCEIIRGFAFEGANGKLKQYKKGTKAHLSGEAKDFAALNRCAIMLDKPEKEEKSTFFSKSSDASLEGNAP